MQKEMNGSMNHVSLREPLEIDRKQAIGCTRAPGSGAGNNLTCAMRIIYLQV